MDISMRSMLTAGVAAVTASAVVFAPTVTQASSPLPDVQRAAVTLAAVVQPILQNPGPVANVATAAVSPKAAAADASTLASGNAIMNFYFYAEPWVQYGFELATWAVGYVPIAGYFSGLIMVAYYTGEPIVQSFFQSAQYAVDGNWGAIPNTLVNGFIDGGQAFVQQGLNWILGYFPPFPPLPPFPGAAVTAASATAATPTPLQRLVNDTVTTVKKDLADTETTIRNIFVPKSLPKAELTTTDITAAAVDATVEPAAAAPTETTSSALRATKPRLTDTLAPSPAATKSTATVGATKAGPSGAKAAGAAKAAGKPGSATHSGKDAK